MPFYDTSLFTDSSRHSVMVSVLESTLMTSAGQVSKLVMTQYGWTFSPSMTSVRSTPWSAGETNFTVMGTFLLVFLYRDLWTKT